MLAADVPRQRVEPDRASTSLGNATLHDLDLTGQLALDRPMLVARIDRPGAQLVLDNAPSHRPRSIRRPCSASSCRSSKK